MEILKKAVAIGKSEIFYELTGAEMEMFKKCAKLLIPKKKKELDKLQETYEGECDIYYKIQELNNDIKFLEYISQQKFVK